MLRPTRRTLLHATLAVPVAIPSAALFAEPAASVDMGLAALAAEKGVLFGTALTRMEIEAAPVLAGIAGRDAALIVPGLELKWSGHRPAPGAFDLRDADFVAAFAAARRQRLRGHTLVWHEALPAWFAQAPGGAAEMRALLKRHIDTVVGHFAGRMQSWDVVNEPIELWYGRPDGLRITPFLSAIGPNYLDLAFRWAHEADPAAKLVLNEYGLEQGTADNVGRRAALLSLLRGMRERDVPVHALGIQAHLDSAAGFDAEALRRFIGDVAALGLDIYVTELDVSDRGLPAHIAARDAAVARTYRDFLGVVLAEAAVKVVVVWGLSDRFTWMNASPHAGRTDGLPVRAHLLDESFRPKLSWHAVAEAFQAAPVRLP